MTPRFSEDQISQASENARVARVRRAATTAALEKQRAALKGMETSRDRGHFINPTRFDARRHEIDNLLEMETNDLARVEECERVLNNMIEINRMESERIQTEWIDAIKIAYPEYGFRSWGGGMEILLLEEDGTYSRSSVAVYFPRPGYSRNEAGERELIPGGVNWSAHGTQDAQTARRYARLIQTAANIAEQANADHIVSGW
jgi:hypothetical protein